MPQDRVPVHEILRRVEKPSRYLGTEANSIHKDPGSVDVHLALVFPDLYDLGLGNLGLQILYDVLNALPWCRAERACAPAPDMEAELRRRGWPLFALESRQPLASFDGVGFTLQSELTFTNVLGVLELAGIPLRSERRTESHPLVFAGGPSTFNPEPMAAFVDFFVIGDGEEAVVELASLLRSLRGRPRRERLEAIARLPGFYVPALHPTERSADGRVLPVPGGPPIRRRLVGSLDAARHPVRPVVPFTRLVHDRVSLEVLRGCTHGCRFCQAGMTTRPARERSVERVRELAEGSLEASGHEELSLVSLSTCDHPRPGRLVQMAAELAAGHRASVSLPSIRLDGFSVDLADRLAGLRRTGLTFAPEAATPRLRAVINKWIPDEDLLGTTAEAFRRGWRHVKLYFMIGLPTETDEDVLAIAELVERVLRRGREIRRGARVHTGVSTFVPKAFTPFQWAAQIGIEETRRRQSVLGRRFGRLEGLRFGRHDPRSSFIEGLLSRSDRRAADLVEAAFRHGARFDGWSEQLRFEAWEAAIEETGFDVEAALGRRRPGERLPWDHLDVLVSPDWLLQDWRRALALEHAPDCRRARCHRCGVIDARRELCAHMLRESIAGARPGGSQRELPASSPPPGEPAVRRLRLRVGRLGEAALLSHLEAASAWTRALRRAGVPLAYSRGFHAQARIAFSWASAVGEESEGDWMDVLLRERCEPEAVLSALRRALPEGFRAFEAAEVALRGPSLMSLVRGFRYTIHPAGLGLEELAARAGRLLSAASLPVERRGKRGRGVRRIDIRPAIRRLVAREGPCLELSTEAGEGMFPRTREVVALLDLDPASTRVVRRETILAEVSP